MLLFSLALIVSAVGPPAQVLGGRAWVGGPGWEDLDGRSHPGFKVHERSRGSLYLPVGTAASSDGLRGIGKVP